MPAGIANIEIGGGRERKILVELDQSRLKAHGVNMDMVLSKTDMGIASRYAALMPDVELRERIFGAIQCEWEDTMAMLYAVTGNTCLLQDNPEFARSLMTRSPYIDPLNHLQVSLLERHRAGDNDEKVKRAIHLTINGIATGLRNSG